mmetsp:Transcript_61610/g.198418  ORF Transcript_61610/g.198418 Transcript_61610/m.198418 type:complete len:500 (-) Transcript_61610:67-1566(-)
MARSGSLALLLLPLLLALLPERCAARVTGGSLELPAGGTTFLSKFAFTFNPEGARVGALDLELRVPQMQRKHRVELLLLDDESDSYPGPSGEWDALSCEEKMLRAKVHVPLAASDVTKAEGQRIQYFVVQKLRPRWWYVALADCSNTSLAVEYRLHTENFAYGWARELGTDRRLVLYVFAPLALLYGLLAAAQARANAALAESAGADSKNSKAAHPFARMLLAGLLLGLGAAALSTAHTVWCALDGSEPKALHVLSQVFYVSSNFVLASMLLLVSQGKCVSYIMVAADARRMCQLLGPFLVAGLVLELWGEFAVSRTYTTDYVYNTPCGWALVAVDLLLLGVYLKNLRTTAAMEHDRGDGRFYRTWGVLYGAWFLALPLAATLSQAVLAPYVWHIVSLSITRAASAVAYAALVAGLRPGNTRTYFKLFTAPESAMEDCVTPPSRRGWDAAAVPLQRTEGGGLPDRFAGGGLPGLPRLPTLHSALTRARRDPETPTGLKV